MNSLRFRWRFTQSATASTASCANRRRVPGPQPRLPTWMTGQFAMGPPRGGCRDSSAVLSGECFAEQAGLLAGHGCRAHGGGHHDSRQLCERRRDRRYGYQYADWHWFPNEWGEVGWRASWRGVTDAGLRMAGEDDPYAIAGNIVRLGFPGGSLCDGRDRPESDGRAT